MKEFFLTPQKTAFGEITEKRSKFIAEIRPVCDEKEATAFIEEVRSKHRDARHTVFSYLLIDGKRRYSDDGEPSGTAGAPITEILEKKDFCNCALTVTRYFGGILLGQAAFLRAYSGSGNKCDRAMRPCSKMTLKSRFSLRANTTFYNRIPSILSKYGGKILDSDFSNTVSLSVSLPPEHAKTFFDLIFELSGGKILATSLIPCMKRNNPSFFHSIFPSCFLSHFW